MESENVVNTEHDETGHAEPILMREDSRKFGSEVLSQCTIYFSAELCPMCSGTIYWAGVSRLVYGLGLERLLKLIGSDERNLTPSLPHRKAFASGQRKVDIKGPLIEDEAAAVHQGFWNSAGNFVTEDSSLRLETNTCVVFLY